MYTLTIKVVNRFYKSRTPPERRTYSRDNGCCSCGSKTLCLAVNTGWETQGHEHIGIVGKGIEGKERKKELWEGKDFPGSAEGYQGDEGVIVTVGRTFAD